MNIEVKIQCDCGTRYKFEVAPLNGRMPQKVSCPGCGVDGTPAANAVLREKIGTVPTGPGRFGLGVVGAATAGLIAMLAWCFLIQLTGYQIGFAAWGVGLLVGLGARALGREGGRRLGLAAGACALVAILGGLWLARSGRTGGEFGWLTLVWLVMAVLSAFKLGASRVKG